MKHVTQTMTACALILAAGMAFGAPLSHEPLRTAPPPAKRAMEKGPGFFVDAARGDDAAAGTQQAPWKTINRGLRQLSAGDTLYLRGGTYYENVYCALVGAEGKPITVRSYPGEQAVIDGGWREFYEAPAQAWEPVPGADGEYRSARTYPNVRSVLGWLGDSMVGLSTYYHEMDLRAKSEVWNWQDWSKQKETDADPLYCGPGLWYEEKTGRIFCRLSHTNIEGIANYKGETDPRKLPLVIAPFRSVPLTLDRAQWVRLQDLVVRGAGYDAVILDYAENVELDNVTVWAGSYGVRAARTGPLTVTRCGFYGSCPPWLFRSDTSKRAYPRRPFRDITRLNTHATWVIESGREFEVFATPVNDNWEISYCDFLDSHDGPYFGGVNLRFHHNRVCDTQDDGIYLSQMYPRHRYMGNGAEIHIYQNYFSSVLTALAFGGTEDTRDKIYIYRNIFDLRAPVYTGRPSTRNPKLSYATGKVIGDHGAPPWPEMRIYQNTFITGEATNYAMSLLGALSKERPRYVMNNILVNLERLLIPAVRETGDVVVEADGNLYWSPKADLTKGAAELRRLRKDKLDANALVADPKFVKFTADAVTPNDYRLQGDSPAVGRGVEIPKDWPDPLRPKEGKADVGALPAGAEPFVAGRTP